MSGLVDKFNFPIGTAVKLIPTGASERAGMGPAVGYVVSHDRNSVFLNTTCPKEKSYRTEKDTFYLLKHYKQAIAIK